MKIVCKLFHKVLFVVKRTKKFSESRHKEKKGNFDEIVYLTNLNYTILVIFCPKRPKILNIGTWNLNWLLKLALYNIYYIIYIFYNYNICTKKIILIVSVNIFVKKIENFGKALSMLSIFLLKYTSMQYSTLVNKFSWKITCFLMLLFSISFLQFF